jgi:hypothetical protein
LEGLNSGISSDAGTGLFAGISENVADVGENAAAAERFEPAGLSVGDNGSGFAEMLGFGEVDRARCDDGRYFE